MPASAGACRRHSPAASRSSASSPSGRSEADAGSSEIYLGTLTLAGLRYGFECRLFVDADGSYFVSDIARFEPVEWHTGIRVA